MREPLVSFLVALVLTASAATVAAAAAYATSQPAAQYVIGIRG
jgi:hypothetical protein